MIDHESVNQLREEGYRLTPQRLAILRILHDSRRHLTPIEVFEQARRQLPGITEPTVYRTLSFLNEQGLAMAAHIGSGQLVYEIAEHAHHHLICRACEGSIEVDHDVLEPLYRELQERTGFRIESLHVTFFGTCPDCQED